MISWAVSWLVFTHSSREGELGCTQAPSGRAREQRGRGAAGWGPAGTGRNQTAQDSAPVGLGREGSGPAHLSAFFQKKPETSRFRYETYLSKTFGN